VFEKHLFAEIPSMRRFAKDCPPELDELVERLLTKDPSERPASASEVEEALRGILEGRPIPQMFTTAPPIDEMQEEEEDDDDQPLAGSAAPPNLTQRLLADESPGFNSRKEIRWIIAVGLIAMLGVILLVAMFRT